VSEGAAGDQTADKQLPFIPRELASASLSLDFGVMSVNVNHLFTGYRFSTETNDPFFVMPGYHKTDGNVSFRLTERPFVSIIRMEVSNIFNIDYQMFPNFPMPRRAFALKILLEY